MFLTGLIGGWTIPTIKGSKSNKSWFFDAPLPACPIERRALIVSSDSFVFKKMFCSSCGYWIWTRAWVAIFKWRETKKEKAYFWTDQFWWLWIWNTRIRNSWTLNSAYDFLNIIVEFEPRGSLPNDSDRKWDEIIGMQTWHKSIFSSVLGRNPFDRINTFSDRFDTSFGIRVFREFKNSRPMLKNWSRTSFFFFNYLKKEIPWRKKAEKFTNLINQLHSDCPVGFSSSNSSPL